MIFNYHLPQSFNHILEVVGGHGIRVDRVLCRHCQGSCGSKVARAGHRGNPRTHWWTLEMKGAVKLKIETYRTWLAFRTMR